MSELTPEEIAAVLPTLAKSAEAVVNNEYFGSSKKTPSKIAIEYKKGVATLKGKDEPFLAQVEDLSIDEQIEAAQKILNDLIEMRCELKRSDWPVGCANTSPDQAW